MVVDTNGWRGGVYYIVACSPYETDCMFDALVAVAQNENEPVLTVLHGNATLNGTVITINDLHLYTNVARIMLMDNSK